MLFDGFPAELPKATLRPTASQARHRVIGGQLTQWLACRWAWLWPRTVPMIAALVGLLAVIGATKYLPVYSSKYGTAAPRHLRHRNHAHDPGDRPAAVHGDSTACGAGSIEVAPAQPAETTGRQ
jgi:hypothetical protein